MVQPLQAGRVGTKGLANQEKLRNCWRPNCWATEFLEPEEDTLRHQPV